MTDRKDLTGAEYVDQRSGRRWKVVRDSGPTVRLHDPSTPHVGITEQRAVLEIAWWWNRVA